MRFSFPLRCVFLSILVSLSSVAFSFSVADYLMPGETVSQVTQEYFKLGPGYTYGTALATEEGINYTLIKINGRETFLLKEDQLVQNATEITPALRAYYRSRFYPTAEEWAEVRASLTQFNTSRNDGAGVVAGKEENNCRQALFLDGRVKIGTAPVQCVDTASCEQNSLLVFQAYGGASAFGAPELVVPKLKSFAFATQDTERITKEAFSQLDSMTEENADETLQYIYNSIPALVSNSDAVETTPFRSPMNTAEDRAACSRICYGICPPMDMDVGALDNLSSTSSSLLEKIVPFSHHAELSTQIEQETRRRFIFRDTENQAAYYVALFSPLYQDASATIQEADRALAVVVNLSFQAKVSQLRELSLQINRTIESRNFTVMDDQLQEFQNITATVQGGIPATLAVYNNTEQARQDSSIMILLLETRALEGDSKLEFEQLRDLESQIDAVFRPGLTVSDYANITDAYLTIAERSRNVMQNQDGSPVYLTTSKFRGFARRVGRGISQAVDSSPVPTASLRSGNSLLIGFSALTFLSLSALITFLAISFFSGFKRVSQLTGMGGFLVVGISGLGMLLFSFGLYHFLDQTTHNADLNEFLFDLQSRNESIILVDRTLADEPTSAAMVSCAQSLTHSLEALDKSTLVYLLQEDACYQMEGEQFNPAADPVECNPPLDSKIRSLFVLNYSELPVSPHLSTIFQNRFEVSGNQDYYQACSIALIFRG